MLNKLTKWKHSRTMVISLCFNAIFLNLSLSTILAMYLLLAQFISHTYNPVFKLSTSDHLTANLLELFSLPVPWRIKFKLCCVMHSVFCSRCPAFLTATVQSLNASRPHLSQRLRSASSTDFLLPQLRIPSLESVFSRMPVPLHGTQCPNTSVLNLTLVFLGNC